jgi:hypothetical protein
MPLSTMASAMVSYSLRPPRKGFPLIEKVFQAFHAMTGVRRGGTPAGTAKLSSAGFTAAATTATKTAKQSVTIVAAPLLLRIAAPGGGRPAWALALLPRGGGA